MRKVRSYTARLSTGGIDVFHEPHILLDIFIRESQTRFLVTTSQHDLDEVGLCWRVSAMIFQDCAQRDC